MTCSERYYPTARGPSAGNGWQRLSFSAEQIERRVSHSRALKGKEVFRYRRQGQGSPNTEPNCFVPRYQFAPMHFVFMPTEHEAAAKSSVTIRWVRWRMCLAFAGLLLTWALICGFVLLALALGWRL